MLTSFWQKVSTKHPRKVVAVSVVLLVVLGWYGFGLFGSLSAEGDMAVKNTESHEVGEQIREEFGSSEGGQILLFESKEAGPARSEAFLSDVEQVLERLDDDATVLSYVNTGSATFLSHDGEKTYALVTYQDAEQPYETLKSFVESVDEPGVSVSIGGNDALNAEMGSVVAQELLLVELISLPILLVLLLVFFRSPVATLIPIGIALFTVVGGLAITRLLSNFLTIDVYAVNIITILGIGLSIDYALLSVNRFREELPKGVDGAVKKVIATSGHTVFFSGATVIACLAALLVFPIDIMRSIAIGGAAAVAVALATTGLVLPSVLKLLGGSIDKGRIGRKKQVTAPGKESVWYRAARLTTSRPVLSLAVGMAVIVLAFVPLLQFKPAGMTYEWLSRNIESGRVAKVLSEEFDSSSADAVVVATVSEGTDFAGIIDLSCQLTDEIGAQSGVQSVQSATTLGGGITCDNLRQMYAANLMPPELRPAMESHVSGQLVTFNVVMDEADSATKEATMLALRDLEADNVDIMVGGVVAEVYDMNQVYLKYAPYAIGIVVVSMIVLLAIALRSIVVPIQAVITNVLGLSITIGMLVGIFQLGWFSDLTGWPQVEGIALTAPILVVTIAFGLAMDYSVFLFSRMREVYDETGDPKQAIRVSIAKTGPIITAAAMAFFVVVAGLAFSSTLMMQMIGVGLAIAVVVDAFFIRLLIVPAVMSLLGRFGWK